MKKILITFILFLTNAQAWAVDIFKPENGQLFIPFVKVGSTTFSNVVVTISNVVSIGSGVQNSLIDTFNTSTNQLSMPSVQVQGNKYSNVVVTLGTVLSVGGSFANENLVKQNTNFEVNNLVNFPADKYDYTTQSYEFAHLGNKVANCFITQTISRLNSSSSPSNLESPFYAFCQQSDGTFKEVSQQLFGQNYSINGGYPVVSDFNGDGIDDLVVFQSWDGPGGLSAYYTFISNINGSYKVTKIAPSLSSLPSYATQFSFDNQNTVLDLNGDGCLDIANANNIYFVGDCKGGFSPPKFFGNNTGVPYTIGTGICAADFNNTGTKQLVMTDLKTQSMTSQPGAIFEIDKSFNLIAIHSLPEPYWNVKFNVPAVSLPNTTTGSHEFLCRVTDINNDGRPDIIIFTRPFPAYTNSNGGWTDQSYVQIYLNQGNYVFADISDKALPGYNVNSPGSYNARVVDLNGDGYSDIALEGQGYSSENNSGNQIWINNKDNSFHLVFGDELINVRKNYGNQFNGLANGGRIILSMLPILVGETWNYIVSIQDSSGVVHIGVANTEFLFK